MRTVALFFCVILGGCEAADDGNRAVGELAYERVELTAEYAETIVEFAVREGDSVEAGQLLWRFDDARARLRTDEAQAALGEARARLAELTRGPREEQIRAARAARDGAAREFELKQTEFARARDVHARGLAAPDALDRARAARDTARAELDRRIATLEELLAGTTLEQLTQAEQVVAQAEARMAAAALEADRHRVRAPLAGIVDSRLFEAGERPMPGQPVLILLPDAQPHARVYVPERLRASVQPGDAARVFVDGLDAPVDGRVRWVASEAAFTPYFALTEHDRGRLTWLAKVDLTGAAERLPAGVPVEVEFPAKQ